MITFHGCYRAAVAVHLSTTQLSGLAASADTLLTDGRFAAGTWLTAPAHFFTLALGSDILGFPWAISTMGWIAGPILLSFCLWASLYSSLLMVEAYRNPSRTGSRNPTFPLAVRRILGRCREHAPCRAIWLQVTDNCMLTHSLAFQMGRCVTAHAATIEWSCVDSLSGQPAHNQLQSAAVATVP